MNKMRAHESGGTCVCVCVSMTRSHRVVLVVSHFDLCCAHHNNVQRQKRMNVPQRQKTTDTRGSVNRIYLFIHFSFVYFDYRMLIQWQLLSSIRMRRQSLQRRVLAFSQSSVFWVSFLLSLAPIQLVYILCRMRALVVPHSRVQDLREQRLGLLCSREIVIFFFS